LRAYLAQKPLFTTAFSVAYLALQGKQQKHVCLNIFMAALHKGVPLITLTDKQLPQTLDVLTSCPISKM
jgi:hypothetical protein